MKYVIIIFISILLNGCIFAESEAPEISYLIYQNLDLNFNRIQEKSKSLSQNEKYYIFLREKKEFAIPFIFNLFIGFGTGSYLQNDVFGGNVSLFGELISYGLMWYSLLWDNPQFLTLSTVSYLSFKTFDLIRPFYYTTTFNNKLQNSLIMKDNSLSVNPYIELQNENKIYGIALNVDF